MKTIPFLVDVDQAILDDMHHRIRTTRWVDAVPGDRWQYGVDPFFLRELTDHWVNGFEWRKVEAAVNMYPQFITEIGDYKIHYLYVKSKNPQAVPLIITHGWPGSFLEMLKVIPLLTASFDLVIPSCPGFGFSDLRKSQAINTTIIAELWVKLMLHLGYEQFIAQGGDLGAIISTRMALNHAERLQGLHLNYVPFSYKPYLPPGEELSPEEKEAQQKTARFFRAEGAYAQVQTTKPRTLSFGLNDSPVGLCAWLLQLFRSFSDPSAKIEKLFNRDELLANISLYWITQTISSSIRLYPETEKEPLNLQKGERIQVPVGIAHYPYPGGFPARKYVERGYNVQYWNDLPKGGHFAAMEQPVLFADDLKAFAKTLIALT